VLLIIQLKEKAVGIDLLVVFLNLKAPTHLMKPTLKACFSREYANLEFTLSRHRRSGSRQAGCFLGSLLFVIFDMFESWSEFQT
jgi:hypothetical protein